jgi:hypothetical protein
MTYILHKELEFNASQWRRALALSKCNVHENDSISSIYRFHDCWIGTSSSGERGCSRCHCEEENVASSEICDVMMAVMAMAEGV